MGVILTLNFEKGIVKHFHGKDTKEALNLVTQHDGRYFISKVSKTEEFLKEERAGLR